MKWPLKTHPSFVPPINIISQASTQCILSPQLFIPLLKLLIQTHPAFRMGSWEKLTRCFSSLHSVKYKLCFENTNRYSLHVILVFSLLALQGQMRQALITFSSRYLLQQTAILFPTQEKKLRHKKRKNFFTNQSLALAFTLIQLPVYRMYKTNTADFTHTST